MKDVKNELESSETGKLDYVGVIGNVGASGESLKSSASPGTVGVLRSFEITQEVSRWDSSSKKW